MDAVPDGKLGIGVYRRAGRVAAQGTLFRRGRSLPLPVLPDGHGLVKGLLGGLGSFSGGEQVLDGVVYRVKDGPLILKFHHGLSRVDIHVHGIFRQGDMQHTAGELALEQPVTVCLLQGSSEELALHKPAVNEKQLPATGAAAV